MTLPLLFRRLLVLLLFTPVALAAQPAAPAAAGPLTAATVVPAHPRLLLLQGEETRLRQTIEADPDLLKVHRALLAECDQLVSVPVLERKQVGKRLLDVSRECLRREFYLAYAWRLTRQEKYRLRAEQELLAVAAFSDWNPSHFLDVAEMTTGVALGYDWLYHDLPETSRATIREAILKKGLEPSLDSQNNGWQKNTNNWNQVCNAGMTFGALAVYEDQPELARTLLNRAIATVPLSMRAYGPDGAYPEGYGYWNYGTSFNVLLINALDKAFGEDFGLARQPGFLKTAAYFQHMDGPFGQSFNYSDAGGGNSGLQPLMFWFADKLQDPSLLYVERRRLRAAESSKIVRNRLLPTLLLAGGSLGGGPEAPAPTKLQWAGGGANPVAMMRTSWADPNAIYLGLKCGSPVVSHGHMDAGSFVLDADGVRWSTDLGMQEYESLESRGIDHWGKQRWQVFRYNNYSHSTLTVNDGLQAAQGYAPLTAHSAAPAFLSATTDLRQLYPALAAAQRGVAIVNGRYVVVRDEVQATDQAATVRWAMLTGASVKLLSATTAELTKDGKTLRLEVAEPAGIQLRTWSTNPPRDYDAPNPGTTLVGFEATLPARSTRALTVLLVPQRAGRKAPRKVKPLSQWPQQPWPTPSPAAGQ